MTLPVRVGEDFEPCWKEDQSSEEYHSDKTAVSSSSLRKILKSPASFHSAHVEGLKEESESLKFGFMVHMAVLEPQKFFSCYIKQPDFGDLRSPSNRKRRDEWKCSLPPTALVLTDDEFLRLEGMVNSILKHRDANAILKHGQPELSGYYRDPGTGIKCKIKPDFLNIEHMTLLDLKTTTDCSREAFSRTIWNYRYDVQIAMYCEGIRQITGREIGCALFLVVEKVPPYEVAVYVCDEMMMYKGREDYEKALAILSQCLDTNKFPPYQSSMQMIQLPNWALREGENV